MQKKHISILAIIVLYKTSIDDCSSYRSLQEALVGISPNELDLQIIIHDNSPHPADVFEIPLGVQYRHDVNNTGLANAYNHALNEALARNIDWLLTLDQDTQLPANAIRLLLDILNELSTRPDVAAIAPALYAGKLMVSPNTFAGGAWPRWFAQGFRGIPDEQVFAFNSGSVLRTSAVHQAGGYSPWFWLDNSDAWIYQQLYAFGKRVYVAGQIELQHDLSLINMGDRVSPERYRTILLAESAFWDMERNTLAGWERTGRLAGRTIKHLLRRDAFALQRLTWWALGSRLFHSRAYRIKRWQQETKAQLGERLQLGQTPDRPMISVCMAAYRGEHYIEAQLRSVLGQLSKGDEIVVVDDASQDGTSDVLRCIQQELDGASSAPRFVLIRHSTNQGVVTSFEDAIRAATGDILFLCDEDDLWAVDKVTKVLDVFTRQPKVQLVCTNLQLIDEHGNSIQDQSFLRHRRFTGRLWDNLIHNQFQGSTMAFRSSLVRHILPLPKRRLFLHDVWIGTRTLLTKGEVVYIDEPLLLYRRHAWNYSRRFPLSKQILLRLQLIGAHIFRKLLNL